MTGSWYGGAFIGAMLGLVVLTGINSLNAEPPYDPSAREAEPDNPSAHEDKHR